MNRIYLLLIVVLAAGCASGDHKADKGQIAAEERQASWNPPAAGTVVDTYKEAISEDKLNNAYFKVTVVATETSNTGHFDLKLEYGGNKNATTIDLPQLKRGSTLKPVLKKGNGKYECMLGFDEGDGIFRPLYLVSVKDKNIKLQQTNYYYTPQ